MNLYHVLQGRGKSFSRSLLFEELTPKVDGPTYWLQHTASKAQTSSLQIQLAKWQAELG